MSLAPIDMEHYVEFAQGLFRENHKDITREAVVEAYQRYEGIT